MEKLVGKVTHYFPKIGVAVVKLEDELRQGDSIVIKGRGTSFSQEVSSMQVEHENIPVAAKGQEVGMKVVQETKEGDLVYKVQ